VTLLVGIPFWVLLHPGLFMMFGGISGMMASRDWLPQWAGIAGMAFQFAVWVYGGVLLGLGTPAAFVGAIRKFRRLLAKEPSGTQPERELINSERRQLMTKAALAVPAAIVATAAGGALASRVTPRVNRLRLPVGREFTQLHGMTIAQVSDVHVGSYMDWDRLSEIQTAMNSLGADLHVITGDLIDNHVNQLELGQRFISGLNPRYDRPYMCMGNHEYIAAMTGDTPGILRDLKAAGARLLIDETEKIDAGGAHFWLMGIDYPKAGGSHVIANRVTDRDTGESLDKVLGEVRDDGAPRILLSHHPKTFFDVRERPIDLTLAGHTHGGQISLGRIGDYELTPVLPFERYHNGLYEHNGRKLYVNAGAGGWMPVRINCPPEITLIEFVPEP
jgi:predicted MPP superfamily phosphohydrolase